MNTYEWYPTENEIIDIAVLKLENKGFNILSTCNTKQHGIDLVAEKNGFKLLVEAKGATSSIKGSKRDGKPFNRNQVRTHISVAIYKVMSLISESSYDKKVLVGICLPYEKNHVELINKVKNLLKRLNIIIFWVKDHDFIAETDNEEIKKLFSS